MKFAAGAMCLALAVTLVHSMPQGYSVTSFTSESLGPEGFITGRSGFSDSSGKKHFTTYMIGPDGKRKILKDEPEGDIEGRRLLDEATKPVSMPNFGFNNFNNFNDFVRPDFFRFPQVQFPQVQFPQFQFPQVQFPSALFPRELFPPFFTGFGGNGDQPRTDEGYGPGQGGPGQGGPVDGAGPGGEGGAGGEQPIPDYPNAGGAEGTPGDAVPNPGTEERKTDSEPQPNPPPVEGPTESNDIPKDESATAGPQ
ncbi:uncharacterized protein LOC135388023 [Ornithodoros turicata]|uniref:uncharacterized protein LOC135388023 n=1 Tax=Ornithodoros turicata TaxID=34597 RepID=UPI00313A3E5E